MPGDDEGQFHLSGQWEMYPMLQNSPLLASCKKTQELKLKKKKKEEEQPLIYLELITLCGDV